MKNNLGNFTVIHINEVDNEVMAIISQFGETPTKQDFDFLLIRGDGNFFVKFKKLKKTKKNRNGSVRRAN